MLDGKISKIEIISKKRRKNMERELRENILNDGIKKEENESKKVIEVREPDSFYPYLAFKSHFDEKQKILKEKRRKKRAMRRKEMGSDYEDDESGSDNEIVGDEFDDETKENENMHEVRLEEAERRSSHHSEEANVGMNGNQIVEETQNGDVHS